ncbi:MAG: FeoB-associated Cys-rich membrane protein [bacterium]|nr:FeoB-associated Cys-rich membrane protein [bacterium]
MENAVVVVIVAAVIAYLVKRAIRNHKSGNTCSGCSGSCPYFNDCPGVDENAP